MWFTEFNLDFALRVVLIAILVPQYWILVEVAKKDPTWGKILRVVMIYTVIVLVPVGAAIGFIIGTITFPWVHSMSKKEEE